MADSKAFLTLGQFSDMFAGGLILSVDETVYNPNGKLPGEWGHYTNPSDPTTWTQTPEVLTVIKDKSIIADGIFKFATNANKNAAASGWLSPGTNETILWTSGSGFIAGNPIYYAGVKIKETQLIYKWIKKSS